MAKLSSKKKAVAKTSKPVAKKPAAKSTKEGCEKS
jgi:hypothetical protein